ncbi:MAG: glutamate--cysteine ligase [Pseudomonadota bacterium]
MSTDFATRYALIESADRRVLAGGRKGVEKESLRVTRDGLLAPSPHPEALGSALTNRYITTDFSEALLEFVTPAYAHSWETQQAICDIHQFTHAQLGAELLWPASMPCRVPQDDEIPLAQYGDSNVGRMKTIYRRGLGYRYGRLMQTIAGVHFNYSLPESFWPVYRELLEDPRSEDEFRSDHYLGLVRNFRRFGWLVLYLCGASPALCRSFAGSRGLSMPTLNDDTLYEPYGTSLRMSDLGYSNKTQAGIHISLNSLAEYIDGLGAAIRTPEPDYERIGVKIDGVYRQLNANKLQIENEYYSSVRPKRVARSGERPTAALKRGGIEYVEIRSLDLNVFDPAGINQTTMRFMEAFLIYCLLEDSPPLDDADLQRAASNQILTAKKGREPGLRLERSSGPTTLAGWAREILDHVDKVAALLDSSGDRGDYAAAVLTMRGMIDAPGKTPSARLLEVLGDRRQAYAEWVLDLAGRHRDYFAALRPLPAARLAAFEKEARESIERQRSIEEEDAISLDEYLERYFSERMT